MRRQFPHAYPACFLAIAALTALSCAGAANLPNPFATATPTATLTFTPSPTPSITPSPTPPPSGRIKEPQPDGTILFTDFDGGYRLSSPKGWRVVILDKEDVDQILESLGGEEEQLKDLLEQYVRNNEEALRVVFFKLIPGASESFSTNVNIAAESNPFLMAMTAGEIIDATQDSLPSIIPGIQIEESGTDTTAAGVEYGYLVTRWSIKDELGRTLHLVQKYVIFHAAERVISMTITAQEDIMDQVLPDFDGMLETVELIEP
jgi:hypothetical protein